MGMDLLLSESQGLVLASDEPFPAEVVRVEFYTDTKLLILGFNDPDSEGLLLDHEIPDDFMQHIKNAASISTIYYENGKPVQGYRVPIIRIG